MNTCHRNLLVRALLLLSLVHVSVAQTPQASVKGAVVDPGGAAIPGAAVQARHATTGAVSSTVTNEQGLYSFPALPIGKWEFTIQKDGFSRWSATDVTLTTSQALELNVSLQLGAVSETVSVTASAAILETRSSDVGQLVESKTIEDMPLGDRRSMNMISIIGGAVFVDYGAGAKPNFSLAGGRTQSQMLWIDGGSGQNMRLGVGQMDIDPPVEVVQEVKVLANNYAAEYGGSAGGVIVTTTKSGGNSYRGSLFEYLRNDKLDAANYFAPTEGTRRVKAPLRYNVFGGTVGGPIRKDRTFFFFSYEGSRRSEGSTRTLTVPTAAQRAGDFSQTTNNAGAVIPIYDPETTQSLNGRLTRTQFPGNRIPASRLDPVALNLMPFYPMPNRPPDNLSGANNFRANGGISLTRNNFLSKVDHNLTDRDKLSVRHLYNSDNRISRSVYPEPAAETVNDQPAHQQYIYGQWTRVFSTSIVNEARFNYGRRFADNMSKGIDGNWPSKIGLKGVPEDAFPQFTPAGFAALGSGTHRRLSTPITNIQFVNSTSIMLGRHTLKTGFDARRSFIMDQLRSSASGRAGFNVLPTGQPGVAASGNGLATMLLGFPTAFTIRDTPALRRMSWYVGAFIQDDWTVSRDLTLNFGLRWEVDTPITDLDNRMNGFDPEQINPVSGTPGVVKFAGVNGWRTSPFATDLNNFGPRFGFAWKPFGSTKSVVRGGYGVFYAHPYDHGAPTSASLGYEFSLALNTPDNGITAPFYLRNGVPAQATAPTLDDAFGAVPFGRNPTTAVTFYETNRRTGYAHMFNLGVQREIGAGAVVEVSYLSNLSRKLSGSNLPINQIPPERLGPGVTQRDRPFPQFTNVSINLPAFGVSSYHAGMLRIEKRFSRGFNLLSTYTYSKFLNNVDEGGATIGEEGSNYSNYYNRRADWGPSENDIRHRFTLSSVYEVPFGTGRRWGSASPLRYVLGDWGLGCVATIQSGAPFTVVTQANTTNAFSAGSLRANVVRDPNLPGGDRTLGRWFDTSAFAQPAPYTFGNQGLNILRADGRTIINLSVLRNFPIGETKKLQFRGEIFNAPNHPNFNLPGATFGAPGFGVVNSASAARQVQLGMRMVF